VIGSSKIINNCKLVSLSELTYNEHRQFEINTKKTIARAIGKKVIQIIEK